MKKRAKYIFQVKLWYEGWQWTAQTRNGRVVMCSKIGFTRERDAWKAVKTLIQDMKEWED